MSQEYVLQTTKLTKIYGKQRAVNAVDLHVRKGDIYGFIGKNGAGKSTFMKMVAGLAAPDAGTIELFGSDDVDRQRMRVGTLIEEPALYKGMTAAENLEVLRRAYGIPDKGIVEEMLCLMGLEDTGKKKTGKFSLGMKQRLGIAAALMRSPDLLILDEPINGLDPMGIVQIRELLMQLNREKNITMIISSHILGELSKIATAYGVIKNGELVDEFDRAELDRRCRRCQKLVVDRTEAAVHVLEEKLHIREFDVPEPSVIRIFERLEEMTQINHVLMESGVEIRESYQAGQDLEGYFMELTGEGRA
ncbi:MAG: ATP-binding cassette domain-containing protein [Bacteroidales bacterium]|nr:ATP-binding cassette domain-containing protein [Bacteroidales bacterium]MCM1416510.1 ATP-binding cassette domain-containing protein [bacterium]MCM1424488.1 ATP-binding cassette domain-containing protein [bacterium]